MHLKGQTMSCITRCMFRWGLIGGLALGGVTLLVGPQRVAAGLSQIRAKAQSVVDSCVDDPVALRHQLAELADEYPHRIAEVQSEIAEVDHQIAEFSRDVEIASKVVALSTEDLMDLKTRVAKAEAAMTENPARPVAIRYEGVRFNVEEAYTEAERINNVREAYKDRAAQDEVQLRFLEEQKARLADILAGLESEFNTFQTQLWQLDRQIDAIERNERLIELTEQQQATLDSYEKMGQVGNLKQLEGKLAQLRAYQQAQLDTLAKKGVRHNYERQAELELSGTDDNSNPFDSFDLEDEGAADDDDEDAQKTGADRTMVWNGVLIIE